VGDAGADDRRVKDATMGLYDGKDGSVDYTVEGSRAVDVILARKRD
jgi:hypothetical protein